MRKIPLDDSDETKTESERAEAVENLKLNGLRLLDDSIVSMGFDQWNWVKLVVDMLWLLRDFNQFLTIKTIPDSHVEVGVYCSRWTPCKNELIRDKEFAKIETILITGTKVGKKLKAKNSPN